MIIRFPVDTRTSTVKSLIEKRVTNYLGFNEYEPQKKEINRSELIRQIGYLDTRTLYHIMDERERENSSELIEGFFNLMSDMIPMYRKAVKEAVEESLQEAIQLAKGCHKKMDKIENRLSKTNKRAEKIKEKLKEVRFINNINS